MEVLRWMTRDDAKTHQLLLLPRDHQKSRLAAYYTAWQITRNPQMRVLYVSSTTTLAKKQVKFIKDILLSPIYTRYWPEMVHPEESKREKWTETEFSVDHPIRKAEAVRDATVFAAGLDTAITGLHCDLAVLDDLVEPGNAYTEGGRETTKNQYSMLASIEGAEAKEIVVGTRYFPTDLYAEMLDAKVEIFDEEGELISAEPLYEVFMREVEDIGDGTGNYIWPREQTTDGRWFGFNQNVLAKKKAQYRNKTHFRAQYYNDPNDIENAPISPDLFQHYEQRRVQKFDGKWYFEGRRLNIFAAIDFAFSLKQKADFTTIVVVGVDSENNIFVLDLDRFKTGKISDYFQHMFKLYQKWEFRKIRAEVTSAQEVIVEDLKQNYIRPHGLLLSIEPHKPNRHEGTKKERINAALQPRYQNGNIWHPSGHPLIAALEEELVMENPAHDDMKDCLAAVMDIIVAPSQGFGSRSHMPAEQLKPNIHPRFGGVL